MATIPDGKVLILSKNTEGLDAAVTPEFQEGRFAGFLCGGNGFLNGMAGAQFGGALLADFQFGTEGIDMAGQIVTQIRIKAGA